MDKAIEASLIRYPDKKKEKGSPILSMLREGFVEGYQLKDNIAEKKLKIAVEALEYYEQCWLYNDPDEGKTARQALKDLKESK